MHNVSQYISCGTRISAINKRKLLKFGIETPGCHLLGLTNKTYEIYNIITNASFSQIAIKHRYVSEFNCNLQVGDAIILRLLVAYIRELITMKNYIMVTLSQNVCSELWYYNWVTDHSLFMLDMTFFQSGAWLDKNQ